MALLAQIGLLHHFDLCGGEDGAVAGLGGKAEGVLKLTGHLGGSGFVRGVDAHMGDLKAQHSLACLGAQLRDLLKVTRGDLILGADPAAAHGVDEGGRG